MKRREFIVALGGAAVLPFAARAQQKPARIRRLGILMAIAADDPLQASYVEALVDGLRAFGWVEGKNIQFEFRWAAGKIARMKPLAQELVESRVDVILAHTSPATLALMNETKTIPIVFVTVTEPLAQGLVKSLPHPGGNVTGFTNFEFSMGGKWLQILKEIKPDLNKATVIFNPDTAPGAGEVFLNSIAASAKSLGIEVAAAKVTSPAEVETAIAALGYVPNAGMVVPPDIFLVVQRALIIELAARHRVPTIYQYDYFTREGGLVSYGVDVPDLFRRAGSYVDRVLNGVAAGELPVQAPTKFQLVVNLKTAKALGIIVPPTLIASADEVIE